MRYRNYQNGGNFLWLGLIIFMMFGGIRTIFLLLPLVLVMIPVIIGGYFLVSVLKLITQNATLGKTVNSHSVEKSRFVELLIHILVHLIKADGKVDHREIQLITQFFQYNMGYNESQVKWIRDLINHSIKQSLPLEEICQEFKVQFPGEPRILLLELLYRVASSDEVISKSETQLIDKIVNLIGISTIDHNRIKNMFISHATKSEDYYAILGVSSTASPADLKKAYRDACKKYHPDKVQHLGDEFKKVAEDKIKKINEAYDILIKQAA